MFVGRVGPVDRRSDGERSRRPREFEYIRYETIDDGRIAAITLDRPKQRNAQTRGMLVELGAAFELAEADDTVRVVILRAAGPAFSAGHDLGSADDIRERSPGPDQHPSYRCNGATFGGVESRNRQEWHYYFENTKRWRNLRKITIAQVHGAVLSAGLMLAWCCDLIVASEDTVFADVVGTRLGMCGVEYFGHPWEFGPRKTKELLLTGDCIGADEAHALGMVSKVFPADELATSTIEFARRIAKVPTMAGRRDRAAVQGQRQTGQSDGRNAARLGAGAGCCAVATAQAAARWRAGTSPVDSRGVADVPLDAQERLELCDLLEELGPAVATLIEGWTAHDLAAHIVLRERDLVAGLCIVLPGPFQRFAERRRARLAQSKDFTWLVARIRSGPPMGFFRIGWVRTLANLNEFFVHHEDVRRASGRGPRSLTPEMDAALWRNVRRGSHFLSRRLHGCGLEIEWVGTGKRVRVRSGEPTARLTGPPGELLLYVFGRRAVARVEVSGPLEAIAAVHRTHFGM